MRREPSLNMSRLDSLKNVVCDFIEQLDLREEFHDGLKLPHDECEAKALTKDCAHFNLPERGRPRSLSLTKLLLLLYWMHSRQNDGFGSELKKSSKHLFYM